jgi:hypothetical protein
MRFTHLLAIAALLCAGQTFAQTTSNFSDSTADTALLRISPYPQLDFIAQNRPVDDSTDMQAQSDADQRMTPLAPFQKPDISCLRIRSYRVARDTPDSDSTHLVSYTTCVRAENLRVYRTVLHPQEDGR